MPEPLSNQSGAEQELPQYIECLLSVSGDAAFLNTFDKAFRSGCGPQWADRPPNTKPRYSFHALFPVPEEIQRRVMSIIYEEIKRGERGSREKFAQIDRALASMGCDCAILGCTELSVFRSYHSLPPFYVDAMEVLAELAVVRCGKQLRTI